MVEDKNKKNSSNEVEEIKNNLKKRDFLKPKWEPTIWDKIDYIYKTLKAEKRNSRIKFIFKLTIFFVIFYFIFFYIPSIPQKVVDNFTKEIGESISSWVGNFIKPILKDFTLDMIEDMELKKWKDNMKINDIEKIYDILKDYPEIYEKINK